MERGSFSAASGKIPKRAEPGYRGEKVDTRKMTMDLKKTLIGEYSGSVILNGLRTGSVIRNRTRIFETEKGHLSYVITEHTCDRSGHGSKRETYVGIVTVGLDELSPAGKETRLHLSPLDKPYRQLADFECKIRYDATFESHFLVFSWKDESGKAEFPLRKASEEATGRRRKLR
jgi:hypothetical protein